MKNPVKAYRNIEFLNSPIARSVRILAEFLEPLGRFKKEGIKKQIYEVERWLAPTSPITLIGSTVQLGGTATSVASVRAI